MAPRNNTEDIPVLTPYNPLDKRHLGELCYVKAVSPLITAEKNSLCWVASGEDRN